MKAKRTCFYKMVCVDSELKYCTKSCYWYVKNRIFLEEQQWTLFDKHKYNADFRTKVGAITVRIYNIYATNKRWTALKVIEKIKKCLFGYESPCKRKAEAITS